MIDTLKTSCAGVGGYSLMCLEMIPSMLQIGIGLATFAYLVLKLKKELM